MAYRESKARETSTRDVSHPPVLSCTALKEPAETLAKRGDPALIFKRLGRGIDRYLATEQGTRRSFACPSVFDASLFG